MKKLTVLSIFISLFMLQTSFAINGDDNVSKKNNVKMNSVTGKIVDKETGEALIGVLVEIEGIDKQTYTDLDGNFNITNIESDVYNISVSYISYEANVLKQININNPSNLLKIELKKVN